VLDIELAGQKATPNMATAINPAFDITPSHLISTMVTEKGIIEPPFERNIKALLMESKSEER